MPTVNKNNDTRTWQKRQSRQTCEVINLADGEEEDDKSIDHMTGGGLYRRSRETLKCEMTGVEQV